MPRARLDARALARQTPRARPRRSGISGRQSRHPRARGDRKPRALGSLAPAGPRGRGIRTGDFTGGRGPARDRCRSAFALSRSGDAPTASRRRAARDLGGALSASHGRTAERVRLSLPVAGDPRRRANPGPGGARAPDARPDRTRRGARGRERHHPRGVTHATVGAFSREVGSLHFACHESPRRSRDACLSWELEFFGRDRRERRARRAFSGA